MKISYHAWLRGISVKQLILTQIIQTYYMCNRKKMRNTSIHINLMLESKIKELLNIKRKFNSSKIVSYKYIVKKINKMQQLEATQKHPKGMTANQNQQRLTRVYLILGLNHLLRVKDNLAQKLFLMIEKEKLTRENLLFKIKKESNDKFKIPS